MVNFVIVFTIYSALKSLTTSTKKEKSSDNRKIQYIEYTYCGSQFQHK